MLLFALLLAASGAAGPEAHDATAYLGLAARYRSTGSATVDAIRAWTSADVSGAQRKLRQSESQLRDRAASPEEIDLRLVEWAALLHLEAGLRALQETNAVDGRLQLASAAALVRWTTEVTTRRGRDPSLPPALQLHPRLDLATLRSAAAGAALAVGFPEVAKVEAEEARDAAPTDATVLLAVATAREGVAHIQSVEERTTDARRSLEDAESSFRDVLAVDASVVEARLRLGRLLAEQERFVEAEPLLDQAQREGTARQRYLALLFLARAAERRMDWTGAFRFYSRALEADPDGAAARLGLALQLERQAGPAAARAAVLETLSRGARLDAKTDPWSNYPFGHVEAAALTLKRLWDRVKAP
jgi:tetratricopeptide (TPR) repeat protein